MYEFELALIALIVSVISAIFVSMKEGIGLSLGFRESETTSKKHKIIYDSLNQEYEQAKERIISDINTKKKVDDESLELITNITRIVYYKDYGTKLLKLTTVYGKRFLRHLIVTASLAIIGVVYSSIYHGLLSDYNYYILLLTLIGGVLFFVYRTYLTIKNYYLIREEFLELSENPTSDKCEEIDDYLEEKEIKIEF